MLHRTRSCAALFCAALFCAALFCAALFYAMPFSAVLFSAPRLSRRKYADSPVRKKAPQKRQRRRGLEASLVHANFLLRQNTRDTRVRTRTQRTMDQPILSNFSEPNAFRSRVLVEGIAYMLKA